MPFVVLLYVDDWDDARAARRLLRDEELGRVVAVYHMPRADEVNVCPGFNGGCRQFAYTRDPEGGHWVHACGRRTKGWRHRIAGGLRDILGYNLLPDDHTPRLFRNVPGTGPTKKRPHPEG